MMGTYNLGQVIGIPIKVHITLLIFLPIIALQIGLWTGVHFLWGLLAAAGLFGSVALHELGHAVVAMAKRIRVREILLLPIGGLAQLERMPERPGDEIQIALAGPLVSLALGVGSFLLYLFFSGWMPRSVPVLFLVLASMNFMLAIFNMLPSFPMDGGRVFRAWLTPRIGRVAATRIAARTGRGMAIFFGIWGLFRGDPMIIVIAIFIYMAAGAEYRQVLMQEQAPRRFGPFHTYGATAARDEVEDGFVVGPPPYERKAASAAGNWMANLSRQLRRLFDDLFEQHHRR